MSESYNLTYSLEAINDLQEIYSYIANKLMVPNTEKDK